MKGIFTASGFALVTLSGFGLWHLRADRDQPVEVQGATRDVRGAAVVDALLPDTSDPPYLDECAHNAPDLGGKMFADVRLDSHNPETNSYAFTVTNFHTVPVLSVVVGQSSEERYLALSTRYPDEILSPDGWIGVAGPGYESAYMSYRWVVWGGTTILEGETRSGFGLRMPKDFPSSESRYLDQIGADNQSVLLFSMETAPFTVHFSDSSCYWGSVSPQE